MSISKSVPDNIKRVARSIGYALWIGSIDQWFGLSAILRARLSDEQRAVLAYQALRSLDYDQACAAADAALDVPFEQGEAT